MHKYKSFLVFLFLTVAVSGEAHLSKPASPPFHVLHYKIDITLNDKDLTYKATTQIRLKSLTSKLKEISLNFREGVLKVPLSKPLSKGGEGEVTVTSEGKANDRNQEGLFVVRPNPSGLPQFFTQFEAQGARQVFPCFDEPFEKATTEVTITANDKYTLLSNGERVKEERLPDHQKRVTFNNEDPISTYLITIVAAELNPVPDKIRSIDGRIIPLTLYVAPGKTEDVRYSLDVLKKAFGFYENYFGVPYPWKSYGVVALPGFTWGGMENKGLANLNEARLLWNPTHPVYKKVQIAELVSHELAHEWFGNKVTLYWWDDLWLNEAFATFMDSKFIEQEFGSSFAAIDNFRWLEVDYFPEDMGALSHPIVPKQVDSVDELFDGITYTKGVQVVRMLEDFVGADPFQQALGSYFKKYANANATTQQFLEEMEEASGKSLTAFAKGWLYEKGYPEIALSGSWDEKKKEYILQTIQKKHFFTFLLNVDDQNLIIKQGRNHFHFSIPDKIYIIGEWDNALQTLIRTGVLPVNRGGRALCRYLWEKTPPVALNDEDPFIRFQTTYDEMQSVSKTYPKKILTGEFVNHLTERLKDPDKSVALGITWGIISDKIAYPFAKAVSKELWEESKSFFPTLSKKDPIEAQLRGQILTLLGQADLPTLYPFLKEQTGSDSIDDQLGAMAGLLRSEDPDRYSIFEKKLMENKNKGHMKLALLERLASTPKVEALSEMNRYLFDTSLVSRDDSSIPIRVWRTVRQLNKGVVYSKEGVEEVTHFVLQNLDRPLVAGQALRTLEDAKYVSQEMQMEIRNGLKEILKKDPPEYITSLCKKILSVTKEKRK